MCFSFAQQLLCLIEDDSCPEACEKVMEEINKDTEKETEKETEKKAGKITVTNEKNEDAVVLSQGYETELDTVIISTDEEITLNSMTFERYGLSTADSIESIWLENENGEKVTTEKTISNSKDAVTLNIKKDYKNLEKGKYEFVVVVKTNDAKKSTELGTNVGFTITSINSSAEAEKINVSAKAYLYNFADYTGEGDVTVTYNGSDKTYSYVDGNSYEVAKVKIKAGSAAVKVNGFTLSNVAANKFDLDKISDVEILANGEKLNKVSFSISKKDEMMVTFPEQEIAINKNIVFTVKATLSDVEDLGEEIAFVIDEASDLNVTEAKTNVRAKVALQNYSFKCTKHDDGTETADEDGNDTCYTTNKGSNKEEYQTYTINGSKITLTNSKIATTVEAAAGSSDVVIASGSIALNGQAIKINNGMSVEAEWGIVESVKLVLNGDDIAEFTKNKTSVKSFDIDEDGSLQLIVDLDDNNSFDNQTINVKVNGVTSIKLENAEYQDLESTDPVNVNGSIIISPLKITAAKTSFINDLTKSVEFKANKSNEEKVVFSGSITAKKSDLVLEGAEMTTKDSEKLDGASYSFDVYVGKDLVATLDFDKNNIAKGIANDTIDALTIKQGDTATVKVIAHIYHELEKDDPDTEDVDETAEDVKGIQFFLSFDVKDGKGNDADITPEELTKIDIVNSSSISIAASTEAIKSNNVVLAETNQTIAHFNIKPTKKNSSAELDTIAFNVAPIVNLGSETDPVDADDFKLVINKTTIDDVELIGDILSANIDDIEINGETTVKLIYRGVLEANPYIITLTDLNGTISTPREFNTLAMNVLVTITQIVNRTDSTKYYFDVEFADGVDEEEVSVQFDSFETFTNVTNGSSFELDNDETAHSILTVTVNDQPIDKGTYGDYFKVKDKNGEETSLKVYSNK